MIFNVKYYKIEILPIIKIFQIINLATIIIITNIIRRIIFIIIITIIIISINYKKKDVIFVAKKIFALIYILKIGNRI